MGRGLAAGFINFVRKKPLPEFRVEAEGNVGSFDFYRAEGDVTGPLFGSDNVHGRLVMAYEDAGSFVDFLESERVVIAPSLEFDLTDSARLLLHGTYQDDRFIPHYGFPLQRDGEDFVAPDVRRSLFFGVPNEDKDENTRELLTGTVQLDHQLGDKWLTTLRLNGNSPRLSQQQDSYAYFLTPEGDATLYANVFKNQTDVWSGEIQLNGNHQCARPAGEHHPGRGPQRHGLHPP